MDAPGLDPTRLPPQLRDLVRALGTADTLRLVRAWGGQRRWIPTDPAAAGDQLRALLSPAGLEALCRSRFAGRRLDVPRPDKILQQAIHAAIRRDRADGRGLNEVAADYGYTTRRVQQICASRDQIARYTQLDLGLPR